MAENSTTNYKKTVGINSLLKECQTLNRTDISVPVDNVDYKRKIFIKNKSFSC
ncbi:unnamed protein product [Acanthoscelides obtectus]|uniref:Uncharacterized protein n=1 Tax=Acanthoscelides obtectus TaxID=200917 RepID=A0A9P0KNC1_ACAOB|nr:unnamed protein product [Acanthoscelides obtectus]CAK1623530.1 hypothetical protein AOBTE_LOCUS2056 [Acanthoscelides obtectus]